jgi:hypothetical protein
MLVTTIGITAVAVLGLLGWRLVKGDSDTAAGAGGQWNQIALVNRTTGAFTTVDDSGNVVAEFAGSGRATDVYSFGTRVALVGADQIALTDTAAPSVAPIIVPIERGSTVTPIPTEGSLHLLVGKPTGGNIVIVDVGAGSAIDVGEAAGQTDPLMFADTVRWAADGSAFAIADAANFQTIIVEPGIDGAHFLPDQPVAVGDDLVATSQTVGSQADIALVDLDRHNQANVPAEIPAGGVMTGDRLVFVSLAGGVFGVEPGDEQTQDVGTIAVPNGARVQWVRPALDGQRLVIGGNGFETLVDLEGGTMFTAAFTTPVDVARPNPAWSCLPVGGGDSYQSLISMATGKQLADLTGLAVNGTSTDGCTVIGERAGITEIVTEGGSVRLGRIRTASLAPDGRAVVVTGTTGRTELVTLDDDLEVSEPIDLSAAAAANLAVVFLGS